MASGASQHVLTQPTAGADEDPRAAGGQAALASEIARVRELFKYFLATSHSIGNVLSDIDAQEGYNPDAARISSDPVLNGLVQLAAHRLACDRAFVSLIDDEHQYVIAEATREISLYDDKLHPPGEGLCIGARSLDLVAGVCAATMPAFTDTAAIGPYKSTSNIYADRSRYIINNFSLEDDYKDRPYVLGFPYMRYYAEVPLKSPSGHVIGTLAVVDNKPRAGLDDYGFLALTEISATMMKHLEKLKIDQDHKQASRLLSGLNNFVHAESTVYTEPKGASYNANNRNNMIVDFTKPVKTGDETTWERSNPKRRQTERRMPSLSSSADETGPITNSKDEKSNSLDYSPLAPPSLNFATRTEHTSLHAPPSDIDIKSTSRATTTVFGTGDKAESQIEPMKDVTISDDVRSSFSRAAHVLRQAMDLDGVIFLDAALNDFGSRSGVAASGDSFGSHAHRNIHDSSPLTSEDERDEQGISLMSEDVMNASDEDALMVEGHGTSTSRKRAQSLYKMCTRLGYSTRQSSDTVESAQFPSHFSLSENIHQSLLRRYPNGHIFDFNRSNTPKVEEQSRLSSVINRMSSATGSRRRALRRRDIDMAIQLAFPNVRSAIFFPLWHPQKELWFAGSLAWTTRQKRVLQKDDLAYLSVFGTSVIAQVTRLDLVASDRAKSDFISSISHELRSPLHGILGSAELLHENAVDPTQKQMITMVEHCGRTMLDTMDHILDFAKINTAGSTGKKYNRISGKSVRGVLTGPPPESQASFELDKVVEETVESLVAGHQYNVTSMKRFSDHNQPQSYASLVQNGQWSVSGRAQKDRVIVVVDIEKQSSWSVKSGMAAWRRIILNLVGNALKYTETGLIEVKLQTRTETTLANTDLPHKIVSLTVRDTGCGISKSYLQSHLYTPFVQENDLSSGTGLGLSIVQKVVHDLHGTINVQSELGFGTQVEVLMPLIVVSPPEGLSSAPTQQNATLCLLGFDAYPDLGTASTRNPTIVSRTTTALKSTLENYAKHWCGLDIIPTSNPSRITTDIILVNEKRLHILQGKNEKGEETLKVPPGSSLIIVATAESGDEWYKNYKSDHVQYLEQPFGPLRFTRVIDAAIRVDRTSLIEPYEALSQAPQNSGQTASPHAVQMALGEQQDDTPKPYLLLVDDNSVNLTMLAAHASRLKCNFATATNGEEAVGAFCGTDTPFDYVLMDVSMPVMDGFTATRAIRDFEKANGRNATPIIALTGLGSAQAQQEAFTSGMDMFLTKPVPMKKIKLLIEKGLNGLENS